MGLFDKIFGGKDGEEATSPAGGARDVARRDAAPEMADRTAARPGQAGQAALRAAQDSARGLPQTKGGRPANDARAHVPPSRTAADDRSALPKAKPLPKPPPLASERNAGMRPKGAPTRAQGSGLGPRPAPTLMGLGGRAPAEAVSPRPAAKPVTESRDRNHSPVYTADAPTIIIEEDLSLPEAEAAQVLADVAAAEAAERTVAAQPPTLNAAQPQPADLPKPAPAPPPGPSREERLEVLRQRASDEVAEILQFGLSLGLGAAPVSWTTPCRQAALSLAEQARAATLDEVAAAAQELADRLEPLTKSATARISDQARSEVLRRNHTLLVQLDLPAVTPEEVSGYGEQLLDALLWPLPGMHTLAVDRLHAARLRTLSEVARCTGADLVRRAELEPPVAQAILSRVCEIAQGHGLMCATEARTFLRAEARITLAKLDAAHARFVDAEAKEAARDKRAARREREERLWDAAALMLQLGAFQAVEALGRGSFAERIAALRAETSGWSK